MFRIYSQCCRERASQSHSAAWCREPAILYNSTHHRRAAVLSFLIFLMLAVKHSVCPSQLLTLTHVVYLINLLATWKPTLHMCSQEKKIWKLWNGFQENYFFLVWAWEKESGKKITMLKAYCNWHKGCVVKLHLKQPCDAALDYFCTRFHISVSVFNYKFGCLRGCM